MRGIHLVGIVSCFLLAFGGYNVGATHPELGVFLICTGTVLLAVLIMALVDQVQTVFQVSTMGTPLTLGALVPLLHSVGEQAGASTPVYASVEEHHVPIGGLFLCRYGGQTVLMLEPSKGGTE